MCYNTILNIYILLQYALKFAHTINCNISEIVVKGRKL